jgi:hypothetical protein
VNANLETWVPVLTYYHSLLTLTLTLT